LAVGHGSLADFQGTENSLSLHRILLILTAITALSSAWAAPSRAGSLTLTWTAPGEDSLVGRAARYDLRYSAQMLTPQNFLQAAAAPSMPYPSTPGATQSYVLNGLQFGVTYYFAIETADQAGNWSAMSNVVSGQPREVAGQPASLGLAFSAPWPNPAREQSRFACALPEAAQLTVKVVDESRDAGMQEQVFDLRDDRGLRLAPGVYLVRAQLGSAVFSRRLVVAR
jgi:hypothetical protein